MNTKKILALAGLAVGGILLLSSFSKGTTDVPDEDLPGYDPNNPDLPGYDPDNPGENAPECSIRKIGCNYIIKSFKADKVYNTGSVAIELRLNQKGILKEGDYIEVKTSSVNGDVKDLINQKVTVVEVYESGGVEYVTTTMQWPNTSYIRGIVNNYLNKMKFGANTITLISDVAPELPGIIVDPANYIYIKSIARYVNNGVPSTGKCVIQVEDYYNKFANVQQGAYIKLKSTINSNYDDLVVRVYLPGTYNQGTYRRDIVALMDYMGENVNAGYVQIL